MPATDCEVQPELGLQCQCSRCEASVSEDEILRLPDDSLVCPACHERLATTCERCGEVVFDEGTQEVDGDIWCETCADEHSFCCSCCDERSDNNNITSTAGGSVICQSCYESDYFTCDSCGEVFHNDDYAHDGQCSHCAEPDEDTGPIEDYDHTYPRKFWGAGPHYFGVELEVEVNADENLGDKAESCLRLFPTDFVIAKHDGSLNHGFELVTDPASLPEQVLHWKKFFASRLEGMKSFDTKTCGLHVHCSREPLTEMQIAKIVTFVNAAENRTFIQRIAGREQSSYAKIIPKKIAKAHLSDHDRYVAVNLRNCDTIEFRIFKGTLKESSFFKALEFCDALIAFAAPAARSLQDSVSVTAFIKHVERNRKLWPHLHEFIQTKWLGLSAPLPPQPETATTD